MSEAQEIQIGQENDPQIRKEMGVYPDPALQEYVTGIGMRLWRSYVLTHGSADSWAWVGGTFLVGVSFLFLMTAIHLGNFTLRNWTWRAPLFAVLESGTEILVSLALTTLNLEPLGADMADIEDWRPTATRILLWRLAGVVLFTVVVTYASTRFRAAAEPTASRPAERTDR